MARKIGWGLSLLNLYRDTRGKPQDSVVIRMLFDLIEQMSKREPFRAAWETAGDDAKALMLDDVVMILEHRIQEAFGEAIRVDGSGPRPWRFALDEAERA